MVVKRFASVKEEEEQMTRKQKLFAGASCWYWCSFRLIFTFSACRPDNTPMATCPQGFNENKVGASLECVPIYCLREEHKKPGFVEVKVY